MSEQTQDNSHSENEMENIETASHERISFKLSSGLSVFFSITLTSYYYAGGVQIPSLYLLAVTAQILSKAIVAVCSFVLNMLVTSSIARKRGLPVDMITATIVEMDCRMGRRLNRHYLLFHGIVSIFIYLTPEILLTNLATGIRDIRPSWKSNSTTTELGSFGGGFDKTLYSMSGLVLLSSMHVDEAYGEVAYKSKIATDEFILPRKPIIFYSKFGETGVRGDSDREKQVSIDENEALSITKVRSPPIESCQMHISNSYKYSLKMLDCDDGVFGFEYEGPDLEHNIQFFQLKTGSVSVRYTSRGGYRRLSGSEMKGAKVGLTKLPRANILWRDMGDCFLNSISFGRFPSEKFDIPTRLAISSIVRITGIENDSGFDQIPKIADAIVRDVTVSNLSWWALLVSLISSMILLLYFLYEQYHGICLTPSLKDFLKACNTEFMDAAYSEKDHCITENLLCKSFNVLCLPHSSKEDEHFDSVKIHKKDVEGKQCDKRFLLHADDKGGWVTIDCRRQRWLSNSRL